MCKFTGRRVAALIVAHLYGHVARMKEIMEIAREYGLPVIEDAAESLGARYQDQPVGTIGDLGCFSFNGNKLITSVSGGMVIARNKSDVHYCRHLSTQAKNRLF